MTAQESANLIRQVPQGSAFPFHHVAIKVRWTTYRLASIADDEIQPRARGQQLLAERLDTRRMPQVEPEDLQPIAPLFEIRLGRIPPRRVSRKARRNDQFGPATQQ